MEQMKYRCPDAEIIGTAAILDYQLLFKGSKTGSYLTIEKDEGSEVPVGIWRVTGRDIEVLDFYEGYPSFYYKKSFILPCSDGQRHRVFAYIMHEDRPLGVPSNWYVNTCLRGYSDFNLDKRFLWDAVHCSLKGGVA